MGIVVGKGGNGKGGNGKLYRVVFDVVRTASTTNSLESASPLFVRSQGDILKPARPGISLISESSHHPIGSNTVACHPYYSPLGPDVCESKGLGCGPVCNMWPTERHDGTGRVASDLVGRWNKYYEEPAKQRSSRLRDKGEAKQEL